MTLLQDPGRLGAATRSNGDASSATTSSAVSNATVSTTTLSTTLPTNKAAAVELTPADERFVAGVIDELVDDLLADVDDPDPDLTHAIARCSDGQGTLAHLFFSDDAFDIARAKAICGKCRLATTCLAGAIERGEAYGVWGGALFVEGQIVAVKRGRGRPPKTPRPALVVDEVPVPPHLVA